MSRENELAANRGAAGPAPAARAMSSGQITAEVLAALGPAKDARAGEILAAVIRHAHDLAREVRLTPRELLAAADFLRRCGEISDAARHEYVLLSDVLGLTMVVDTEIADVADGALETSVLGPFYRAGAPWEVNGANISRGTDDGEPAHIRGQTLPSPAFATQRKTELRRQLCCRKEEVFDSFLAIGQPIANKNQIAPLRRIAYNGMMARGIKAVINWMTDSRAQPLIMLNDWRPASVSKDEIVLWDQCPKGMQHVGLNSS